MQTKTYTTETAAKKAAARAYGRYVWSYGGHPLPQGARTVSRWGMNQWHAYR